MPYLCNSSAIVTPGSLERDCSCLVHSFSITFLYCIWTGLAGAEVGRYERFVFLILAFSLSDILFLFDGRAEVGVQNVIDLAPPTIGSVHFSNPFQPCW